MISFHQLTLDAPESEALMIAAALENFAAPAPQSVSVRRMGRTAPWRIEVVFHCEPDADALNLFLATVASGSSAALAPLANEDWVALSQSQLPPIRTQRFYIHAPHVTLPQDLGARHAIMIDAGLAFGTGHHVSTRGCLAMIEFLMGRGFAPRRVLDLGAGTALLAIAVQKAWPAARVLASDNDPVAVRVARENCASNCARAIRHIAAEGFRHTALRSHGAYDLVLANILAAPLRRLAPDISVHMREGGILVLSGILDEQSGAVVSAYRGAGFRLVLRRDLEGWAYLLMARC